MIYELKELSKNEKWTWLANIVSQIFEKKEKNSKVKYRVSDWKKEKTKTLIMWWKEVVKKWKKQWLYYALDENWNQVDAKTQKSFLPIITAFLMKDWFKNPLWEKEKEKEVKDLTKLTEDDFWLDIDFDNLSSIKTKNKKEYWIIEILHELFNSKWCELYFPIDETYKKVKNYKEKEILNENIKWIYKFKKLIGWIMIDYPFEKITNLWISSSSFNIVIDCLQPMVIEDKDWNLVETVKFSKKVLVENWNLRVNWLIGKLTKDKYELLFENWLISEKVYNPNTLYKINLKWNVKENNEMPIISNNIKNVKQDEIVDTVFDINHYEIKNSYLNSQIKDYNSKLSFYKNYEKSEDDKYLESLWIFWGTFKLKWEKEYWTTDKKEIETKIEISAHLTAADNRKIENDIENEYKEKIEKQFPEKNYENTIDMQKDILKFLESELKNSKNILEELRYKLNLIKMYNLNNWIDSKNNYYVWNWDEILENTKSAKSADWFNHIRFFSNKNKTKNVRVKIQKLFK